MEARSTLKRGMRPVVEEKSRRRRQLSWSNDVNEHVGRRRAAISARGRFFLQYETSVREHLLCERRL